MLKPQREAECGDGSTEPARSPHGPGYIKRACAHKQTLNCQITPPLEPPLCLARPWRASARGSARSCKKLKSAEGATRGVERWSRPPADDRDDHRMRGESGRPKAAATMRAATRASLVHVAAHLVEHPDLVRRLGGVGCDELPPSPSGPSTKSHRGAPHMRRPASAE